MFTGIIEEVGRVKRVTKGSNSAVFSIEANMVTEDLKIGDSIAVNGVCLTTTDFSNGSFNADVMHETLNRSALADMKSGDSVNLERAMPLNGRFGGHIVSGHVDCIGVIKDIRRDDNAVWYTVDMEKDLMKYIVEKGSIAIDGISLTVAQVSQSAFSVSVIPHTDKSTVLSRKNVNDKVNIETDIIGKYIEKLQQRDDEKGISVDFLRENGF